MTDLDRPTTALADGYTIERELGTGGMATVVQSGQGSLLRLGPNWNPIQETLEFQQLVR